MPMKRLCGYCMRKAVNRPQYQECGYKMNNRNIIIFEYQPTRGGVHPTEFLKGFIGYLICYGYDAYNAVSDSKQCGCWTHTRRYFVNALPKDKSAYSTSVAAKEVNFCDRITTKRDCWQN